MKMNTSFDNISVEDLTLVIDGAYAFGNSIDLTVAPEYEEQYKQIDGDSWPEKFAKLLMAGGKLIAKDYYDEGNEDIYGKEGVNWIKAYLEYDEDYDYSIPTYVIDLRCFENGFNCPDAKKHAIDLVNGDDDAITAYCLLQATVFGEVVYG